jgi:hypothetical protein
LAIKESQALAQQYVDKRSRQRSPLHPAQALAFHERVALIKLKFDLDASDPRSVSPST